MDAAAKRAHVTGALAVLAVLAATAAPAQAQEVAPTTEIPPLPEEAALLVEQATRSEPGAVPGLPAQPAEEAQEELSEAQEELSEGGPPTYAAPAPQATTAPESATAAPGQPALEAVRPAPDVAAPPEVQPPQSQPVVQPEHPTRRPARDDRRRRLVVRVDARLETVERGIDEVRQQLDAGQDPSPRLLGELAGSVGRLRSALTALQHDVTTGGKPLPVLRAIEERVDQVRHAAMALVFALKPTANLTPGANALIYQLVALDGGLAPDAPDGATGPRTVRSDSVGPPLPGSPGRPHPGSTAGGIAYTQLHAPPTQFQSESSRLTRRVAPSAGTANSRRPLGPPDATPGSAAAATSSSFFSVAGPAALALLLGLSIPRLLRRLARLPVCRPPELAASPPERPG